MRPSSSPCGSGLDPCHHRGSRLSNLMGIFSKPAFNSDKKREFPGGLWQKCPSCGEMIHNLELIRNFRVCPKCDHHFTQSARERLEMLLDPQSFTEHDAKMVSVDTLKFTGMASYTGGSRLIKRRRS